MIDKELKREDREEFDKNSRNENRQDNRHSDRNASLRHRSRSPNKINRKDRHDSFLDKVRNRSPDKRDRPTREEELKTGQHSGRDHRNGSNAKDFTRQQEKRKERVHVQSTRDSHRDEKGRENRKLTRENSEKDVRNEPTVDVEEEDEEEIIERRRKERQELLKKLGAANHSLESKSGKSNRKFNMIIIH